LIALGYALVLVLVVEAEADHAGGLGGSLLGFGGHGLLRLIAGSRVYIHYKNGPCCGSRQTGHENRLRFRTTPFIIGRIACHREELQLRRAATVPAGWQMKTAASESLHVAKCRAKMALSSHEFRPLQVT